MWRNFLSQEPGVEFIPKSGISSKGIGMDTEQERINTFLRKPILGAERLEVGHAMRLNSLRVGNLPSTKEEGTNRGSETNKSKRLGNEEREGHAGVIIRALSTLSEINF